MVYVNHIYLLLQRENIKIITFKVFNEVITLPELLHYPQHKNCSFRGIYLYVIGDILTYVTFCLLWNTTHRHVGFWFLLNFQSFCWHSQDCHFVRRLSVSHSVRQSASCGWLFRGYLLLTYTFFCLCLFLCLLVFFCHLSVYPDITKTVLIFNVYYFVYILVSHLKLSQPRRCLQTVFLVSVAISKELIDELCMLLLDIAQLLYRRMLEIGKQVPFEIKPSKILSNLWIFVDFGGIKNRFLYLFFWRRRYKSFTKNM